MTVTCRPGLENESETFKGEGFPSVYEGTRAGGGGVGWGGAFGRLYQIRAFEFFF